jgi:hypothetical protein
MQRFASEFVSIINRDVEKLKLLRESPSPYSRIHSYECDQELMKKQLLKIAESFMNRIFLDDVFCIKNSKIYWRCNNFLYPRTLLNKQFLDISSDFISSYFEIFSSIKNRRKIITINEFNLCDSISVSKYRLFYKKIKIIWVFRDPRDGFTSWIKHRWISEEKIDNFINGGANVLSREKSLFRYEKSDALFSMPCIFFVNHCGHALRDVPKTKV